MSKKLLVVLSALLLVSIMFTACGQAAPAAAEEPAEEEAVAEETAEEVTEEKVPEETYKVGIAMFVMDAGMTRVVENIKKATETLGFPIEYVVTSADSKPSKQNSDIEDLVTMECDLIWVQGFDMNSINGALEYAYDHGVQVAVIGEVTTDKYTYRYINADDETPGLLQAEWFAENYLSKNPDTEYKVALVDGTMTAAGAQGRHNGVLHGLEDSGYTNYEIVVTQDCNFVTETAQAFAEGLMTSHPEVNVIFCANDDMALGVINAIEAVGRTGEIVVLGIDGMDTGLQLLQEEKMVMTVYLNKSAIGEGIVKSIHDSLTGNLVVDENKMAFADAVEIYKVIDSTNLSDYLQ